MGIQCLSKQFPLGGRSARNCDNRSIGGLFVGRYSRSSHAVQCLCVNPQEPKVVMKIDTEGMEYVTLPDSLYDSRLLLSRVSWTRRFLSNE
jgi:hypothetical protein